VKVLITNVQVYTVSHGVIDKGSVLVEDGKISQVSAGDIQVEGATVVDGKGLTLMPGFIDAHTHVGISEEGFGWEGADYNEWVDPVTPYLRAIDGINPMEQGVKDALEGGITTIVPETFRRIGLSYGIAVGGAGAFYGTKIKQVLSRKYESLGAEGFFLVEVQDFPFYVCVGGDVDGYFEPIP